MSSRLPRGRERGSGTVLALGLIGVAMMLASFVIGVGSDLVARHRAEAAADLAALAAAGSAPEASPSVSSPVPPAASPAAPAGGCRRARAVAAAGGADLVGCRWSDDGSVVVEVVVPVPLLERLAAVGTPLKARARARAGRSPPASRGREKRP